MFFFPFPVLISHALTTPGSFLSICQCVCPFIQETGGGLVLSPVQNMTEHLPSLLTGANSLQSLHQQSGASLTNVPSSQSCQHINKPWLNDPWHHICLCVRLDRVGVWQTQLLESDPLWHLEGAIFSLSYCITCVVYLSLCEWQRKGDPA